MAFLRCRCCTSSSFTAAVRLTVLYLLSLYGVRYAASESPSRWLRSPSSGDLHDRFSAMSAMAMRPPGGLPPGC
jgi:hypothetical protein